MRHIFSTLIFATLVCLQVQAQSCFPNGIVFFSQQDIDAFKINYPNCKVIGGDVNIEAPDATNLNGLSNLTHIQGTLSIAECDALTNLGGLSEIKTLGHLYIAGNDALTSIEDLSSLTTVGGIFFIQDNNALTNLNGLQNLKTIGGDCWIHYSSALTNISALNGLTSVGGELGLNYATGITNLNALGNLQSVGSISFSWNDALVDISGLQNIAGSLDSIAIWGNPNLQSLNGLQQISKTSGPVFLLFNQNLSSLSGLEGLTAVGGNLTVSGHKNLTNLNALSNLGSVGGGVEIQANDILPNLGGLSSMNSIGGNLDVVANQALGSLQGLGGLQTIGGSLKIQGNPILTDLTALQNLSTLGGDLELNSNYILPSLQGFSGLNAVGGGILVNNNDGLSALDGLQTIATAGGEIFISQNDHLLNLDGLDGLQQVFGAFAVSYNPALISLSGLSQLSTIGAALLIQQNDSLLSLVGLEKLVSVGGQLAVWNNPTLANVNGLNQLMNVGGNLEFQGNGELQNLDSLFNLTSITGNLRVEANYKLEQIKGLENLSFIGGTVEIKYNYQLAECAIPPVCQRVFSDASAIAIYQNAPGCQTVDEISDQCSSVPVVVSLRTDPDGDCLPGGGDLPVAGAPVWLTAPGQATMRPTDSAGITGFRYFNNGPCFVMPARFPDANWEVCGANTLDFVPGFSPDTLVFLLKPKNACPELTVQLGLPSIFTDCSITAPVSVSVRNTGTALAQGVQAAVAMPPEMELISSDPPLTSQTGDTLFYNLADLAPLAGTEIRLEVKTKCSGVPIGRALCWSASGTLANGCSANPSPSPQSEVRLRAECTGASVRFTLKNTGSAPTPAGYEYTLFRNGSGQTTEVFALAAGESKSVEVPADGATWRMEATRLDDGTLTAVSYEGCNGFEPGWVTAYWQDGGALAADFDCRQVDILKNYTGKHAFPGGVGPQRLLAPNKPLRYTIDFHNFETEEVSSVSLQDNLPPTLNMNSIRPVAASHPYTWEVRNGNTMRVVFEPILLDDTLGNVAAAHGFFTFEVEQMPDLPDGVVVENIAETYFGSMSPFGRDTAWHTISTLGANSHKCLPIIPNGTTYFYTQEHIDNFPLNFPGCTEIEGDLNIGFFPGDITNLDGFSQLRSVGGSVHLSGCDGLNDLHGLHNLRSVGQSVGLSGLPGINDLNGLNSLHSVDSLLSIQGCASLKSLHGLDSLTLVRYLAINYNDSLTDLTALSRIPHQLAGLELGGASLNNLDGLQHIDSIGVGGLILTNSGLSDVSGLSQIRHIAGVFGLSDNPALTTLAGLSNLTVIGSHLGIERNEALTSLAGLSALTRIGGSFMLSENPAMLRPAGPPNLKTIAENFFIRDMAGLEDLEGLASLDSLGGTLIVHFASAQSKMSGISALHEIGGLELQGVAMPHLTGLDSIRTIRGNLSMYGNPGILDFGGMSHLETIGGTLGVENNGALQDFQGLDRLHRIGGGLIVRDNPALQNFAGAKALQEIDSLACFHNNAVLTNFSGLDSLRYIGDSLVIWQNHQLSSLQGLSALDTIGDDFWLHDNQILNGLTGLENLRFIGEDFDFTSNQNVTNTFGLESLEYIGGNFTLGGDGFNSNNITSLEGLSSLAYIGGDFILDPANIFGQFGDFKLSNFHGLENLAYIGGNFPMYRSNNLNSLGGLQNLGYIGGDFIIGNTPNLNNLNGLQRLKTIGGNFDVAEPILTSLTGLDSLTTIGGALNVTSPQVTDYTGLESLRTIGGIFNPSQPITSFKGLENLKIIGDHFYLGGQWTLKDCTGLNSLDSIGGVFFVSNAFALKNFHGIENLRSVGNSIRIESNPELLTLEGLDNLEFVGGEDFYIDNNPKLRECAIFFVCKNLFATTPSPWVSIWNNASGCDGYLEVKETCNALPVEVHVRIDVNGDCLPDADDTPVGGVHVQLTGGGQSVLRGTGSAGATTFRYFNAGPFTLSLPQYPSDNWDVCQTEVLLSPAPGFLLDTLRATLLLVPLQHQCAELTVNLGLPPELRGCLVNSDMEVLVRNTGSILAENVQLTLIKPKEIEVLSADPPLASQTGDTLVFDMGHIAPLKSVPLRITVKTNCNFPLIGRTLCFETFARTLLPCPLLPLARAEIKLGVQCLADTLVQFTIKNIGDAPTQGQYEYRILRNAEVFQTGSYSLAAQQNETVDVPADGATWRMEATKFDDGSRTAVALENCGGLTSDQINAFWHDKGPAEYDFDCRNVAVAVDPNQKTAVPTGAGPDHILEANVPLRYTIDFQNTGTDTAFRVLLRDVLPAGLDVSTFRPGLSSHANTWQIRGADTLEVLFFPIMLPDSNVNEPASHGFFTFEINQLPDLPIGTVLDNTASIIFDFNPPIVTNTVLHRIGRLTVRVDAPQPHAMLWRVLGNPTRDAATFLATSEIAGEKRFELFDVAGRPVRTEQFSGKSFEFRRDGLPAGWYIFRIEDTWGRVFSGKIVVVE